jgi:membrane fusion protein, copper/silver efflux system
MNSKRKSTSVCWLVCLLLVLVSCRTETGEQGHEHHLQTGSEYICPMRCEGDKTYPQPGSCPVCKMDLQEVAEELVQVVSPNHQVLSNQATVLLQSDSGENKIKAQGFIVPAQNENQSVAARFGGRIEKLYVRFSNQFVRRGEKIMDLYSPELRTIQEEHLFLYRSNTENTLLQNSRERLRLLGVSESQINQLETKGLVSLTISVVSDVSGYVFFGSPNVQEVQSPKAAAEMNTMSMQQTNREENNYATSATQIREGMYINAGQTLFTVNPLRNVWAVVSVSNSYLNLIRTSQPVEVIPESNPSSKLMGKIALMEPTFQEADQRFARVRIVLNNAGNLLKINSLVTAHFTLDNGTSLRVPSSAVYKTGLHAFVWVKIDTTRKGTGVFQTRRVIIGPETNGMTLIKGGLLPTERIALRAGLMTDSETFLDEN